MEINCISCAILINESAIFCFNCGTRAKCRSCEERLIKGARFCTNCGASTQSPDETELQSKNTIVYRKTKEETFYEVSLTDVVGKEGMRELIQGLTSQNYAKRIENGNGDPNQEISIDRDEHEKGEFEDAVIQDNGNGKNETLGVEKDNKKQLPHIKDLEINLEKTESEWLLIYAFYLSDFGKKTFTKELVHDKYMATRKTLARQKNYSNNWKSLFKEYISTVSETELKIKSDKIEYINNLILGENEHRHRTKKQRQSSSKKREKKSEDSTINSKEKPDSKKKTFSKQSYSFVPELNLVPKGKESLKEYYSKFISKNHPEIILIIIYYLERILKENAISENKIYHCYKEIGEPVPELRKALGNARSRYGWINTSDYSNLKVTVSGENHIEHKMKRK